MTIRILTPIEARVLGTLMEKARTVPDSYPLSLNALISGCNQKTSRDPLMEVSDDEARAALDSLKRQSLVFEASSSRVPRYEHNFQRAAAVSEAQAVVMGLLLLRGPQTPAELRTSGDRWYRFADSAAVETVLEELQQRSQADESNGADQGEPSSADSVDSRGMVQKLPRSPGAREQRWTHLLCGAPDIDALTSKSPTAGEAEGFLARITALENKLAQMAADNAALRAHVHLISEQLGIELPAAKPTINQ